MDLLLTDEFYEKDPQDGFPQFFSCIAQINVHESPSCANTCPIDDLSRLASQAATTCRSLLLLSCCYFAWTDSGRKLPRCPRRRPPSNARPPTARWSKKRDKSAAINWFFRAQGDVGRHTVTGCHTNRRRQIPASASACLRPLLLAEMPR